MVTEEQAQGVGRSVRVPGPVRIRPGHEGDAEKCAAPDLRIALAHAAAAAPIH